jgi:hypothetical protein
VTYLLLGGLHRLLQLLQASVQLLSLALRLLRQRLRLPLSLRLQFLRAPLARGALLLQTLLQGGQLALQPLDLTVGGSDPSRGSRRSLLRGGSVLRRQRSDGPLGEGREVHGSCCCRRCRSGLGAGRGARGLALQLLQARRRLHHESVVRLLQQQQLAALALQLSV